MRISGKHARHITTADTNVQLVYDLDMSVTSTTGEAFFGISGFVGGANTASNGREVKFKLASGRVFDPENRCVYSYKKDKDINFKGTFLPTEYDYFIDNNLICSKGSKTDFKVRHFFFDSVGCSIDINDLNIYERSGALALTKNLSVDVYGSGGSSGSAGISGPFNGDTVTFSSALKFNENRSLTSSILSGQVVVGSESFEFDNSATNLAYLKDTPGSATERDLKLIAKTTLAPRDYDILIDFYTTFGKVTAPTKIKAVQGENSSGVVLGLIADQEGQPLNSGAASNNLMELADDYPDGVTSSIAKQGRKVRAFYDLSYGKQVRSDSDNNLGLPYKVYLEHVEGDHSKNYSFITGVQLSGSGLGYNTLSDQLITFRAGAQGTYGTAGSAGIDATSLGTAIDDVAFGLVSDSSNYSTQLVEAYSAQISKNLYTSTAGTAGTNGNIFKTNDGALIRQKRNNLDVACIIPNADGDASLTKELATGIPMYFEYTKPASDWKLYIGDYGSREDSNGNLDSSFTQQSATGIQSHGDGLPLRYHSYGTAGVSEAVTIAVEAKNYVDTDPMIYNLVVSGSDGIRVTGVITGTNMDCGPFDHAGAFNGEKNLIYDFPNRPVIASV